MIDRIILNGSLVDGCLWQTTLCLFLGLMAARAWSGRPARAHRALALAILAALVLPVMSHAVRCFGWGVFVREAPGAPATEARPMVLEEALSGAADDPARPTAMAQLDRRHRQKVMAPSAAGSDTPPEPKRPIPWVTILVSTWVAVASLAMIRLVLAFMSGRRLRGRAEPMADASVRKALNVAARQLALNVTPELLVSSDIRCPAICCWGRRPSVLLPASMLAGSRKVDWSSIFCHELAHLKRRDHLWSLLAELTVSLLPWNPLAWWSRRWLMQLSDRASDDWVLAAGHAPTDYAEVLVSLVPRRPCPPAMATVSSRRGLRARVSRILVAQRSQPAVGLRWLCAATLMTAVVIAAIALAQARPAKPSAAPQRSVESAIGIQPAAQPAEALDSGPVGFAGRGSGTNVDPYIIADVLDLQAMQADLTGHYVLGADIDASATRNWNGGQGFVPIGLGTEEFTGSFDGKGHAISNLHIDRIHSEYQGLFAVLNGATVRHVNLVDATLRCDRGGILAARAANGSVVAGCSATGKVTLRPGSDDAKTGGLIGAVGTGSRVDRCFSGVDVQAGERRQVGALIGYLRGRDTLSRPAVLSNSYSYGTVTGNGRKQGNLLGDADASHVDRCYSRGYGKALIGFNWQDSVITNCYWDRDKGAASSHRGGTPQSTAGMMHRATFANWDFTEVWDIVEGSSYPCLRIFGAKQRTDWTGQAAAPRSPRTDLAVQSNAQPAMQEGIAWGRAVAGLQAGISLNGRRTSPSCEIDDTLALSFYLRNVTTKSITHSYLEVTPRAWRPLVANRRIDLPGSIMIRDGRTAPRTISLGPGECRMTTHRFSVVDSALQRQPEAELFGMGPLARIHVEPGMYRIVYAPELYWPVGKDPPHQKGTASELASGELALEILPAK